MTAPLTSLNIGEALDHLAKGDFTATELTKAHLAQMEKHRSLNAFITETADTALAQAAESDKRYASKSALALDGIPLAIKDLFCTKDIKTTAASRMLENFVPTYESTVSGKLLASGTICLGKANLDEFAMGGSNRTSYFGPAINPWQRNNNDGVALVPGGSSGGSAAAVAAQMAMGATGTDTGGSTRQPGSFCGIVGVKPTYGRCSRYGVISFASSLDQSGVFARSVRDSALLLEATSGFDPKDSTSANREVPNWASLLTGDIRGLRVGIPKEYRVDGMPAEIDQLWEQGIDWLKQAGAEIVEISLPHTKYAVPTYYIVAPAEASSNLARYDGMRYGHRAEGDTLQDVYENSRAEGFGAEVTRRIMLGTYVLSAGYYDAYYIQAQKVRRKIANDFTQAFEKVDVILTPTSPSAAFAVDDKSEDPIKMYLGDAFTVPASLAGLPGISVPAGFDQQGLPLGLQVIGQAWDETTMFRVADVLERSANITEQPTLLRA